MLASGEIHTTSWMPGSDWQYPFDTIYCYAARQHPVEAAKCFGLFVNECVLERADEHGELWGYKHCARRTAFRSRDARTSACRERRKQRQRSALAAHRTSDGCCIDLNAGSRTSVSVVPFECQCRFCHDPCPRNSDRSN